MKLINTVNINDGLGRPGVLGVSTPDCCVISLNLMEGKERKIRLPEYKRDFGNTEAEEMTLEFFKKSLSFVTKVERASGYDNQKTKIDYTIFWKEGPFVAVQQKFTQLKERVEEAVKMILQQPLVQLHNEQGELLSNERIPLVMIQDRIENWGKAYNRYLKEKLGSPLDALGGKPETKKKFLEQMLACLKTERYYFPLHWEIIDPRISVLEKELHKT